jgi:hypothetical protein
LVGEVAECPGVGMRFADMAAAIVLGVVVVAHGDFLFVVGCAGSADRWALTLGCGCSMWCSEEQCIQGFMNADER